MVTVRQLERFWDNEQYDRMLRSCLEMRAESSVRLLAELSRPLPVAAMTVIRLNELGQDSKPLAGQMLRFILESQEADGGWGELITTALCLRALLCGRGDGAALDRGLSYLASLQKDLGIWPRIPMRRMPADPFVSAFILFQLAGQDRFTQSVRFADALAWFESNAHSLDLETQKLWRSVSLRCGLPQSRVPISWS